MLNLGGNTERKASSLFGMRLFLIILVKERITMVKVTLKGGAVKEYDDNVTVAEIAKSLGGGLYKACLLYTSRCV